MMDPRRRGVPVVDGTECITAVHQEHDYGHVAGGRNEAWYGEEARRNLSLAGALDDSSYTTGASWILDKQGRLVKAQARQSEFSTPTHRCRRVAWLARQAEELTALGRMELAACKWEEAVTILDKLLTAIERQSGPVTFSHDNPMAKSYTVACTSLARCYLELGCPDRAVACYTRLLETVCIEIPQGQRDDIARERSRLRECQADDHTQPVPSSAGPGDSHVAGETSGSQGGHLSVRECGCDKRIALIVSIPERSENLRCVLRDIEPQVDEIRILLNEFEAAPEDLHAFKRVSSIRTSRTGELFASGVWNLLGPEDEGYVFVLDDDIAYPADYVERMVAKIDEHRRQAVMVVHGIDFCEPFTDCTRDRIVYRFEAARSRDGIVDAGGVGTLAFHTSTLRPHVRDFPNPNFRDLWFAVLAARRGVPILCVARDAHWLRSRATQGRQLWYRFSEQKWKDVKNLVFRQNLLPLLDIESCPGRTRRQNLSIFCITNGRSTFEYSVRSLMESLDLQEQVHVFSGMHFLDAMTKCIEICETPYFFKIDDDFILHPGAIAYMRNRVREYPKPEELGIYYCHLWEDWTSRVRESIKVYNVQALRKIGGFQADPHGKVDRTTLARLEQAGYGIVADPGVVAIHACGAWQEQLEYERLWSSMAQESYRKPTHEAMKKYCGTKSLDEQYDMRLGLLEHVNEQLNTPFYRFLVEGEAGHLATPRAVGPHPMTGALPVPETCGVTLFAMPKAFTGHTATIQKNAIRSWACLEPSP
ncbi:MAG: hypothetical protein ABFE13_02145, partial [Phycisphaerales bacterium]